MLQKNTSITVFVYLAKILEEESEYDLLKDIIRILSDCAFSVFSGGLHINLGLKGLETLLEYDNLQLEEIAIFIAVNEYLYTKFDFALFPNTIKKSNVDSHQDKRTVFFISIVK